MEEHLGQLANLNATPAGRREGPLELRVWNATQDQLALGLLAAREIFQERGMSPYRAGVCSVAISAYDADQSLPEPDAEVRRAAAAFSDASEAAILAAGGALDSSNHFSASQWPDGRQLWNTLPTLRAYRKKHTAQLLNRRRDDSF